MTQIRPQDFLSIPTVPASLPNLFPKLHCPLSSLSKAESVFRSPRIGSSRIPGFHLPHCSGLLLRLTRGFSLEGPSMAPSCRGRPATFSSCQPQPKGGLRWFREPPAGDSGVASRAKGSSFLWRFMKTCPVASGKSKRQGR